MRNLQYPYYMNNFWRGDEGGPAIFEILSDGFQAKTYLGAIASQIPQYEINGELTQCVAGRPGK